MWTKKGLRDTIQRVFSRLSLSEAASIGKDNLAGKELLTAVKDLASVVRILAHRVDVLEAKMEEPKK